MWTFGALKDFFWNFYGKLELVKVKNGNLEITFLWSFLPGSTNHFLMKHSDTSMINPAFQSKSWVTWKNETNKQAKNKNKKETSKLFVFDALLSFTIRNNHQTAFSNQLQHLIDHTVTIRKFSQYSSIKKETLGHESENYDVVLIRFSIQIYICLFSFNQDLINFWFIDLS